MEKMSDEGTMNATHGARTLTSTQYDDSSSTRCSSAISVPILSTLNPEAASRKQQQRNAHTHENANETYTDNDNDNEKECEYEYEHDDEYENENEHDDENGSMESSGSVVETSDADPGPVATASPVKNYARKIHTVMMGDEEALVEFTRIVRAFRFKPQQMLESDAIEQLTAMIRRKFDDAVLGLNHFLSDGYEIVKSPIDGHLSYRTPALTMDSGLGSESGSGSDLIPLLVDVRKQHLVAQLAEAKMLLKEMKQNQPMIANNNQDHHQHSLALALGDPNSMNVDRGMKMEMDVDVDMNTKVEMDEDILNPREASMKMPSASASRPLKQYESTTQLDRERMRMQQVTQMQVTKQAQSQSQTQTKAQMEMKMQKLQSDLQKMNQKRKEWKRKFQTKENEANQLDTIVQQLKTKNEALHAKLKRRSDAASTTRTSTTAVAATATSTATSTTSQMKTEAGTKVSKIRQIVETMMQSNSSNVNCQICFEPLQDTHISPDCLHRFCGSCFKKSIWHGNKECPQCRCPLSSRRTLRQDKEYDTLLQSFHDIDTVLKEEEEDKKESGDCSGDTDSIDVGVGVDTDRENRTGVVRRNANANIHNDNVYDGLIQSFQYDGDSEDGSGDGDDGDGDFIMNNGEMEEDAGYVDNENERTTASASRRNTTQTQRQTQTQTASVKFLTKRSVQQFQKRLEQLDRFKALYGHLNVSRELDSSLADWCWCIRRSYRYFKFQSQSQSLDESAKKKFSGTKIFLTEERVRALRDRGFDFQDEQCQYLFTSPTTGGGHSAGLDNNESDGNDRGRDRDRDRQALLTRRSSTMGTSSCGGGGGTSGNLAECSSDTRVDVLRSKNEDKRIGYNLDEKNKGKKAKKASVSSSSSLLSARKHDPDSDEDGECLFECEHPVAARDRDEGIVFSKYSVEAFNHRLEALRRFKEMHGHLNVTYSLDASLANWCHTVQKSFHDRNLKKNYIRLTKDRIQSLEEIGFEFEKKPHSSSSSSPSTLPKGPKASPAEKKSTDSNGSTISPAHEVAFNQRMQELEEHKARHGNIDVRDKDNKSLAYWCWAVKVSLKSFEKGEKTKIALTEDRIRRLKEIGFEDSGLGGKKRHSQDDGGNGPKKLKKSGGKKAKKASVSSSSSLLSARKHDPDSDEDGECLFECEHPVAARDRDEGIVFSKYSVEAFNHRLEALRRFKEMHGHLNVTYSLDASLANWCHTVQKSFHDRNLKKNYIRLTKDRIQSLEEIGFEFEKKPHSSSSSSSLSSPSTLPKGPKASPAEKKSTDSNGSTIFPAHEVAFNQRMQELEEHKARHGNIDVRDKDNKSLAFWCWAVKVSLKSFEKGEKTKIALTEDRIRRLKEIGFEDSGLGGKKRHSQDDGGNEPKKLKKSGGTLVTDLVLYTEKK